MHTYEQMIIEACEEGIEVIEINFKGEGKGYCCDNVIAISKKLTTNAEKRCVLIEEISHFKNNHGYILDQSKVENRKQERVARNWGYRRLVRLVDLINAYRDGVKSRFELAEYLEVTEDFVDNSLKYYKDKYGLYYEVDNYLVYFDPLVVVEKL